MDLSVIIVNWNTREMLARCLESVVGFQTSAAHYGRGRNAGHRSLATEIFVVDNASTDDSARMVRERFPVVHLIANSENLGFARANNQAISLCRGCYVLLLNSDTRVVPGALETMVGFLEDHPEAGGCGPLLLNADGSLQLSCHPMLTPWREFWRLLFLEQISRQATYDMDHWDLHLSREVEVIKGACLMLRRDALDQVGLMDPRYFIYTEEMDLCYRLRQAGWSLFWVPEAQVVHYGEGSTKQVAEAMYVQLYLSKMQFYRKVGGEAWARLFKVLLVLAYVPRFLVSVAGAFLVPTLAPRALTYRRLLAELRGM